MDWHLWKYGDCRQDTFLALKQAAALSVRFWAKPPWAILYILMHCKAKRKCNEYLHISFGYISGFLKTNINHFNIYHLQIQQIACVHQTVGKNFFLQVDNFFTLIFYRNTSFVDKGRAWYPVVDEIFVLQQDEDFIGFVLPSINQNKRYVTANEIAMVS